VGTPCFAKATHGTAGANTTHFVPFVAFCKKSADWQSYPRNRGEIPYLRGRGVKKSVIFPIFLFKTSP
jgi:hypothetical protein